MIKQGDIAFVKTTGECIFVLSTTDDGSALVRRPVAGQDGITHVKDGFLLAELETVDEQRARFMAEQKNLMEKYGPKAPPAPGSEDFGPVIN
jgi:hypothetical protein